MPGHEEEEGEEGKKGKGGRRRRRRGGGRGLRARRNSCGITHIESAIPMDAPAFAFFLWLMRIEPLCLGHAKVGRRAVKRVALRVQRLVVVLDVLCHPSASSRQAVPTARVSTATSNMVVGGTSVHGVQGERRWASTQVLEPQKSRRDGCTKTACAHTISFVRMRLFIQMHQIQSVAEHAPVCTHHSREGERVDVKVLRESKRTVSKTAQLEYWRRGNAIK